MDQSKKKVIRVVLDSRSLRNVNRNANSGQIEEEFDHEKRNERLEVVIRRVNEQGHVRSILETDVRRLEDVMNQSDH